MPRSPRGIFLSIRYASVYRDFRETGDFARFLGEEGLHETEEG